MTASDGEVVDSGLIVTVHCAISRVTEGPPISHPGRGGYDTFVAEKLHGLLDALSNEKRAGFETVGPGLRGQVQWDRTLVARRAGTLPAGRYFSRVAHRTFDMPINRVLAWLIHDLSAGLRAIKTQVGSQRLTPRMERMDAQLQEALGHHWLSDVEPSANVQADLGRAAERNRKVL